MKTKYTLAITVLVGLIGLAVFWPKSTCDASSVSCEGPRQPQTTQSQADTIQDELQANTALLIDVREPEEFAIGHAKNASNMPLADIEASRLVENNKNKIIYVYCKSGRRAEIAKTALEEQGFMNIKNLGGLSDWQAIGGQIVK